MNYDYFDKLVRFAERSNASDKTIRGSESYTMLGGHVLTFLRNYRMSELSSAELDEDFIARYLRRNLGDLIEHKPKGLQIIFLWTIKTKQKTILRLMPEELEVLSNPVTMFFIDFYQRNHIDSISYALDEKRPILLRALLSINYSLIEISDISEKIFQNYLHEMDLEQLSIVHMSKNFRNVILRYKGNQHLLTYSKPVTLPHAILFSLIDKVVIETKHISRTTLEPERVLGLFTQITTDSSQFLMEAFDIRIKQSFDSRYDTYFHLNLMELLLKLTSTLFDILRARGWTQSAALSNSGLQTLHEMISLLAPHHLPVSSLERVRETKDSTKVLALLSFEIYQEIFANIELYQWLTIVVATDDKAMIHDNLVHAPIIKLGPACTKLEDPHVIKSLACACVDKRLLQAALILIDRDLTPHLPPTRGPYEAVNLLSLAREKDRSLVNQFKMWLQPTQALSQYSTIDTLIRSKSIRQNQPSSSSLQTGSPKHESSNLPLHTPSSLQTESPKHEFTNFPLHTSQMRLFYDGAVRTEETDAVYTSNDLRIPLLGHKKH